MKKALRDTLTVARREAAAYLLSPIAWIVLVLFLVVQGFSFWAVLQVVADPARPGPYGAVLRTHSGGTFLYWTVLFFVVAVTTMRLVAEERRQGTWETLLTAPVGEGPVVAGKWLGALAFFAFLWAPTVAYPILLGAFAPPGAGLDWGPILSAYAGVLVTGASFLALGLVASAATANQIVAAVVAFVAMLALLLAGMTPELAPGFFTGHATLAAVAGAIDVRRHMDSFARGVIDLRQVALHGGLLATALTGAVVLARAGRVPRAHARRGALGVALVAAAALLLAVIAARHPAQADLTRDRVYTLDAKTRQILADVHEPVRALVLVGQGEEFRALYDEVEEILRRFEAVQPLIAHERLDPALEPGRAAELAERFHLAEDEISEGGVVVFVSGPRTRAVALLDMARIEHRKLLSFDGEAEFASAVLEVTDETRPEVCFTTGHGELGLLPAANRYDLSGLAAALARDLVRATPLDELAGGVPERCAAVAIFGLRAPFGGAEALALHRFLEGGGRLLLAVEPDADATGAMRPTGLETVLLEHGVKLGAAIVVDPAAAHAHLPLTFVALWTYADHPITGGFRGRRGTSWLSPRLVEPAEGGVALVTSTAAGWGERDIAGLVSGGEPARWDEGDAPGPAPVAVAAEGGKGWRVVVFGSARSFVTAFLLRREGVNDALVTSAVAWLTGRTKLVGVGAKTPEQFRVVMTRGQVRRGFVLCVVLLPLAAAGAGLAVLLRRRRA
jgi:ABC-2 type transport system permease protein